MILSSSINIRVARSKKIKKGIFDYPQFKKGLILKYEKDQLNFHQKWKRKTLGLVVNDED